jgi:hypothetical protein
MTALAPIRVSDTVSPFRAWRHWSSGKGDCASGIGRWLVYPRACRRRQRRARLNTPPKPQVRRARRLSRRKDPTPRPCASACALSPAVGRLKARSGAKIEELTNDISLTSTEADAATKISSPFERKGGNSLAGGLGKIVEISNDWVTPAMSEPPPSDNGA